MKKVGVITGDLIHSGKLDSRIRELVYQKLEAFLKEEAAKNKAFQGETNQGDWFQCLLKTPANTLRYALIIKTYLRSFAQTELPALKKQAKIQSLPKGLLIDARIAVGVGSVDFVSARLGASDGEAFRISGRLLEKMKKSPRSLAGEAEGMQAVNEELKVLLHLLDFILSKATPLQCQVIHRKLVGKKETDIAGELKILQSAVNQRSTASGWSAIEAAVNRFETLIPISDE